MKKIAIVDYGLGNLFSIKQALKEVGAETVITSKFNEIEKCDGILLPGVGAFGDAMNRLGQLNLIDDLKKIAASGKPILGVCLGLQLLFEKSHEFGVHEGLGLIPGEVLKFPKSHNDTELTVPFIGWNNLQLTQVGKKNRIFSDYSDNNKIYFVHSFYVSPKSDAEVLAECQYHDFKFPAVVGYKNIIGIQGHPEKSGKQGLAIYKNWVSSL